MNTAINKESMKVKKTVTIDVKLVKWMEEMVEKKEFGSLSHAIEKALSKLKEEYEKKA
jgi:Arc/MetJ-type ribon-helix-helix transcriptional regulator